MERCELPASALRPGRCSAARTAACRAGRRSRRSRPSCPRRDEAAAQRRVRRVAGPAAAGVDRAERERDGGTGASRCGWVAASYCACQKSVSMPRSTSRTVRWPSSEGSGRVPSGMRTVIEPPWLGARDRVLRVAGFGVRGRDRPVGQRHVRARDVGDHSRRERGVARIERRAARVPADQGHAERRAGGDGRRPRLRPCPDRRGSSTVPGRAERRRRPALSRGSASRSTGAPPRRVDVLRPCGRAVDRARDIAEAAVRCRPRAGGRSSGGRCGGRGRRSCEPLPANDGDRRPEPVVARRRR